MYVLGSCSLCLDGHVGVRYLAACPAMMHYASEDSSHFVGQQTAETRLSGEALRGQHSACFVHVAKRSSCTKTAGRAEWFLCESP
jgi:hypothetical protein